MNYLLLRMKHAPAIALGVIFPGFFIYHYLAGIHAIPLFAGGYASLANAAVAALLLPILAISSWTKRESSSHIFFLFLCLLITMTATYYRTFGSPHQVDPVLFTASTKLILGLVALYAIGRQLRFDNFLTLLVRASFAVMTAAVVLSTNYAKLRFDVPETITPGGQVSDYQGFATAYAVIAIFALVAARRRSEVLIISALGALCLFLISARAEMLGFGFAVCAFALVEISRQNYAYAAKVVASYVAPIASLLALPYLQGDLFFRWYLWWAEFVKQFLPYVHMEFRGSFEGNFRQAELLAIAESQSLSIRLETIVSAWRRVSNSPLIGEYGGQIREFGGFGYYAHNILSAWSDFGLAGFSLYVSLCISAVIISAWSVFKLRDFQPAALASLMISSFSVGLVLLLKSIYWPIPALAWGLSLSLYVKRRSIQRQEPHPRART